MARSRRRTGRKRLTQKDKALQTIESRAKQALRRLHQLRVRELLGELERILKRLRHASKLDQKQLHALTHRGLAAINNFERQAGRPPIRTRAAEVGEEDGGGPRGNGSCEAQCAADLEACMQAARSKSGIAYDIAMSLCMIAYEACMAECAFLEWLGGGGTGDGNGGGWNGGGNGGDGGDGGNGYDGGDDGGGGGCFVEGTPVLLADQKFKMIEQVSCGDRVLSKDERTGEVAGQRVNHKWIHADKPTLLLHLSNGETLETTCVHRFFVDGKGFVPASSLQPGTRLLGQTGGDLEIVRVEPSGNKASVYNLGVEHFHTFFVGTSAAWVHNAKEENGSEDDGGDDGGDGGD